MKVYVKGNTNRFILSLCLAGGLCSMAGGPALAQVVDTTAPRAQAVDDTPAAGQPMTDLQRFNALEKRYFGHGYPNDAIEDRLFRMENLVFGGKTKAPLPDRIFKLEAAIGKPAAEPPANEALNPGESTQAAAAAAAAKAAPSGAEAPVKTVKEAPKTFNSLFSQATADIDATRFHAAADELEQAIQLNPNNARAYSLLGETLLKLQDRDGAKEAFRACFQVDPFGADGRSAKAMLLKMVSDDTVRATAPQDTPQVVSHTIQTLNLEAADLANRYRQDGNRWAAYRRYLGNIEAQKMEGTYNGGPSGFGRHFRGGGFASAGYTSPYGGYRRGEISSMARLSSNYIRTDSIVQANYARAEAARKAAFVQESAANLKDQMLKPTVLKDDAKLKALGTTLYCRYYGDETPSVDEPPVPEDPILELKARAMGLTHK
jgi:TolA-binding protein